MCGGGRWRSSRWRRWSGRRCCWRGWGWGGSGSAVLGGVPWGFRKLPARAGVGVDRRAGKRVPRWPEFIFMFTRRWGCRPTGHTLAHQGSGVEKRFKPQSSESATLQRRGQENRIFCTKKQGVFRTKDPSCKTVRAKPAFVESHVQVRANSAGCMATGRRTAVTPINKQHFLPASLRPPPVIVDGSTPRFIRSQRNAAPEPYTKVGPRI